MKFSGKVNVSAGFKSKAFVVGFMVLTIWNNLSTDQRLMQGMSYCPKPNRVRSHLQIFWWKTGMTVHNANKLTSA